MGVLINVDRGELDDLKRRVRQLENRTTLNNAALGRAGMEIYDQGTLNVSDGNLIVNGTATISGILNADGTVTLTGIVAIGGPLTVTGATQLNGATTVGGNTTVNGTLTTNGPLDVNGTTTLDGDTTVTGPLHVNGATDINGSLDVDGTMGINGATTLTGNLSVTGGGIIDVGPNMTLNPAVSGGSIQFYAGGGVENAGGVTVIKGAGNAGLISNGTASVFAASNSLDVSPSSVSVTGPLRLNSLTSTASDANVYFDPISKQLYYKP